jgi:cyclic beta-1,2-glucan synthetase
MSDSEGTNPKAAVQPGDLARRLAQLHRLEKRPKHKAILLWHLQSRETTLRAAYAAFRGESSRDLAFTRASEWLLDNFHLVEQTLRLVREDLPEQYYDELPKLEGTALKGYPRIFALAWEWVGYNQDQIDLVQTMTYVQQYQQVAPLKIGELWALPNMLRIGLLEHLARAAAELTGISAPKGMSELPSEFDSPAPANEIIVANCIISLRLLSVTDWKDFLEQTSRVEQILREESAGIHANMDFGTRNSYRNVIEDLARHSTFSEEEVARAAVNFAAGAAAETPGRQGHAGYYLRDAGRAKLENYIHYRPGFKEGMRRALLASPTLTYLGSIGILSALPVLGLMAYAVKSGATLVQLILAGVLGLGMALEAAIMIVNWIVTHSLRPQSLPRMDYSKGIPEDKRTMIVVPSMLESENELNHLLQGLELNYLSNPDAHLTYALLTDFGDAPAEHMPDDERLLELACEGIENLNKKYTQKPFYLFHRQRQWNPSEGVWMGWERKRGKLMDFNRLLLNQGGTAYTTQVGEAGILPKVKYVITLDADTSLPQDSARRLVATLTHPLNQAEFAADGRSVSAGYTVMQPRVAIKPTSARRTLFSQIFAGSAGFDLYSFAVSDVYQDLFGEGIYVGKGIYDVAAFERSLEGQVRQNTLLSHDLFEGIAGRAALVTDIVLYEEYPSRYLVYTRRMQRWIRGDWQLLPWLFPIRRRKNGTASRRFSTIDIWKILDNLRRSLTPPATLAMLVAGWMFLPGSSLVWTLVALLPSALPVVLQTMQQGRQGGGRQTLRQLLEPVRLTAMRWGLGLLFLPYEALLVLGAIGVTIARLLIVRRNLLQWKTAAQVARSHDNTPEENWRGMAASTLFAILVGVGIWMFNMPALMVAAPILTAWLVAPQVAYGISRPSKRVVPRLSEPQRREIQRLARRTWAFFEQFSGPDDHWLPPDHFQESPRGNVVHLTTPTNIGMLLTSALAAYDLGYIGQLELAVRLRSVFESMDKLEHYRGHLLNWYDTQTLTTLQPRYISTVDSGNLAACLITLKQGCLAIPDALLVDARRWQGVLVILDILTEALKTLEKNDPDAHLEPFEIELSDIYRRVDAIQDKPAEWRATLTWLAGAGWNRVSLRLMELLQSHPHLVPESLNELRKYLNLLHQHLLDMQRGIDLFVPWLKRLDSLPASCEDTTAWREFRDRLPAELPTLKDACTVYDSLTSALNQFKAQLDKEEEQAWCQKLGEDLLSARMTVEIMQIGFQDLAEQANAMVNGMDFRFLFDDHRQVFHIGYNASTEHLDTSYYDLLASEARIASLIAIAKGDVPHTHWQQLGRPVTRVNGRQVLLSWSGTMFEYLMPTLFTRSYAGTFLAESCETALDEHIRYGQEKKTPWGISESGFYAFDVNLNYQYRAFGVPDLGFQRDLSKDLVITPYASLLGLSLRPLEVLKNILHLEQLKMLGVYGFYEAIDYTRKRLGDGRASAIVKSYMAHHQGMILAAACNYLMGDVMVRRFHADERIQSVELLLQEKIPQKPPIEYPHPDAPEISPGVVHSVRSTPWSVPVDSAIPQVHVLAREETSVVITSAGGGYSQWRDLALTRWQPDTTLDDRGTWIYLEDRDNHVRWSAAPQPMGSGQNQQVLFHPHMVEFLRWDAGISLRTEITMSAQGVEIRRVNILNDSNRPRRLRLTSYGEVVLAPQADDRRHPGFNKLFIESEYLPKENALVFHRRLRSANEGPAALVHAMVIEAGRKVTGKYETSRLRFLGRNRTGREYRLSTGVDAADGMIDPIFSLSQEIDLKPYAKTRVTFLTAADTSRARALEKLHQLQNGQAIHSAFTEARTHAEFELLELGMNGGAVENAQRVLSALLHPAGVWRPPPHVLAQNEKGQSGLWAYGISGDLPILLARIRDGKTALLNEVLQAFSYWRSHQVRLNLVILNEQDTGYGLELQNLIQRRIRQMGMDSLVNLRDGIFILRMDQLPPADQILLQTVVGVVLDEKDGSLSAIAQRMAAQPARLPPLLPSLSEEEDGGQTAAIETPGDLLMDNGFGGFSRDGREYVIHLEGGQHTPRPWINVIANPDFGFTVSEAGFGHTWAGNSSENRLTPWRNDPVTDMPGEAIYLRDEETGRVWSPTLMPAGAVTKHVIRHGAGYSLFESQSHGLNQKLRVFAAKEGPVKIVRMHVRNLWQRPRRITITYYAEWVLGTTRDIQQAHVRPEFDADKNALLAGNAYNAEFGGRVAFLAANKKPHGVTADRTEFLGRLGSMRSPAALGRIGLASAVNAGLDPCAAIQLHVDLAAGAEEEVYFLLGEGSSREESLDLIGRMQAPGEVEAEWQAVQKHWDDILDTITVETPDAEMDLMLNRWLLYQALACRVWGRTALYQPGGAFGFRDQLQDVLAMVHARPDIARSHILEAARHQFEAGDVLHWWNPPGGRGVRTRFSDDLLWLPFVAAEYVEASGDTSILDESIPFLKGELLQVGEYERYAGYEPTETAFPLLEHLRRVVEKGSSMGAHGLPLMGTGDWNDGMNLVGAEGRGESVWLGWFLHATLERFASLAERMGEDAERYHERARRLAQALENHAWDGEWYLRAFYDDGSRLGSHENDECQIDSIAQSWAVISGAGDPGRAAQAMESVDRRLVRPSERLILLFTPPFNKTLQNPGYIKGYPPGMRENGGQYTHAAIWTAWAFANLGQGNHAGELFQMLNPIGHADTPEKVARYQVEPYVIAADIQSEAPQTGSGGWTWYSGSAAWMYRLGIEMILGLTRHADALEIDPCIPGSWKGFKVNYRFGSTTYMIHVENPQGVQRGVEGISVDGNPVSGRIRLSDDGSQHEVHVRMGAMDTSEDEEDNKNSR